VVDRPFSTTSAAYMTTTSSAISATTPRSCVIMMIALRTPLERSSGSGSAPGRHVERGRRLVGDQQSGSLTSAIAIITRWRIPPENWCG
jgi:hypothetical protein